MSEILERKTSKKRISQQKNSDICVKCTVATTRKSPRLLTGSQACAGGGRKSKLVEQEKTQSIASGSDLAGHVVPEVNCNFCLYAREKTYMKILIAEKRAVRQCF